MKEEASKTIFSNEYLTIIFSILFAIVFLLGMLQTSGVLPTILKFLKDIFRIRSKITKSSENESLALKRNKISETDIPVTTTPYGEYMITKCIQISDPDSIEIILVLPPEVQLDKNKREPQLLQDLLDTKAAKVRSFKARRKLKIDCSQISRYSSTFLTIMQFFLKNTIEKNGLYLYIVHADKMNRNQEKLIENLQFYHKKKVEAGYEDNIIFEVRQ